MKYIYLEITPFFPTETSFRGPYVYDQVKAIQRNSDYDVIVIKTIYFYQKENVKEYVYQGVKVYNFKVFDIPFAILPGLFQAINLYRLNKFIKNVVKIDMSSVEVIHGHVTYPAGNLAVSLGNQFGIKSLVQHHGLDVMQLRNGRVLKGKLKQWNNQFIKNKFLKTVNAASLNIGVSQKVVNQMKSVEGFLNLQTFVLYNGVDTAKFYKTEAVKKSENFTIGCIGNFWPSKDQITLLKAVNILVQKGLFLNVKLVGSGSTLYSCMEYVAQQKLCDFVEFFSEVDHTQLNDFYNLLDLFVLPSYDEAFGCVYAEALHVGVPIIAVKGQGIEEIIIDDMLEYSLILPHDYISLANCISYYMSRPKTITYDLNIDYFIRDFFKFIKMI